MNSLILGSYNDTTCTTFQGATLYLTETCVATDNSSSTYVSSSGEFKTYISGDCTGSSSPALKLDTCVNVGRYYLKTSLVAAKSSASSKSSLQSLSALLVAGVVYAALGL